MNNLSLFLATQNKIKLALKENLKEVTLYLFFLHFFLID